MKFLDSLHYAFFQRALLEAVLLGAVGGVASVHVLLRRLPFFVVAVSHATFPGVVVASLIGVSVFWGGAVAAVLVAVAVVVLGGRRSIDDTSAIGVVLAGAFAAGVVLLLSQPSSGKDLSAFLVGSILTVDVGDLVVMSVVGFVVLAALHVLHNGLVFSAHDSVAAAAAGYRVRLLDLAVLVLVAITAVVAIPAVGTLLTVALLTVPALTARQWVDRIMPAVALSVVFGVLAGVLGLAASAQWDVAAGGAIALSSAALFVLSALLSTVGRRRSSVVRV
jgi:ABC-type Mn2+/Zn2+ transport system permease subunit